MAQANTPLPVLDLTRALDGYHRADDRVGTPNYLGVLTTVNCSTTGAKLVAEAATGDLWFQSFENIDGIVPIVHGNGGEMDNSSSPGNKRGGLTTILEKSLGAVAKGGATPMMGFYEYAQPITTPCFSDMDSPGYDPASVTGQIANGANLIAFTTGCGSGSGFKPAPGLKLATNTEMYNHMAEDMDINCGDIITGGVSIADKGREIFEALVAVASGKQTKSEKLGFGGAEFVPWQIGAVM